MTLYRNERIYVDASGRITDAVLVRNGFVVAIGERATSIAADDGDPVFEIDAACVMPALCDAHIHLWGFGLRDGAIDLRGATTTAEVYSRLENAPQTEHGWILASGWDQNRWSDGDSLDLATLDAISKGRPMSLRRVDEHALWANSVALKHVEDSAIGSGSVERDSEGLATGLLIDDAMAFVSDHVPERTIDEDRSTCLQSAQKLRSYGITSAHVAWVEASRLSMLSELVIDGALGLHVHPMLDGKDVDFESLFDDGPTFFENHLYHVCSVKFFADGALGSRGAHLLEPYDDGSIGLAVADDQLLARAIPRLAQKGWQVCIHAIGDRANRRVLEHFNALSPAVRAATRPRVEHAQMVHDDDIDKFFDVIASVQPIHMYSDGAWVADRLRAEQTARLFRWRDLGRRTRLAAGSDYPIEDPNPWHGMSTALSRAARDGLTFYEEQKMTRSEIVRAYTSHAAYSAFWEDRLGSLKPGMVADLIGIDTDPFIDSAETIWDTGVTTLIAGGVIEDG